MKRFSILSLVILFLFTVVPVFAGGDDEDPPYYTYNGSISVRLVAGQTIPEPATASIPTSGWDYHDGSLTAQALTYSPGYNIRTTAYAEIHDGTATDTYSISKTGHTGSANTPIDTGGVGSGSFYRVTMSQSGQLPPGGALSTATIALDYIDLGSI